MNMKKNPFFTIILLCAVLFIGFTTQSSHHESYNSTPDISTKVIGSKEFKESFFIIPYQDIEEACNDADLIVIGTVTSSGETEYRELYSGEPEMHNKYRQSFPSSKSPTYPVSKNEISVDEILFGSCDKLITLTQNGEAGTDIGETKVKKGERMLFILHKDPAGENMWSSVSLEDGLFLLRENGKVLSLTDNLKLAKYDDRSLNLIKKDIKDAVSRIIANSSHHTLPVQEEYDVEDTESDSVLNN